MSRSLSAGAVFRGCVDRGGVILSIDETSDTVARAGLPLRNLIAPAEREQVDRLLRDEDWSGVLTRPVALHTGTTAVLVAAAVRRLLDVVLLPDSGTELDIHAAGALLRALLEDADDGIWVLDGSGGTVTLNARMHDLLAGQEPAELPGVEHAAEEWRDRVALHPGGPEVELTGCAVRTGDRARIGSLVRASIEGTGVGEYPRLVRTRLHDPLTGLPGRPHLLDRLAGLAQQPGIGTAALLRCAIDGFTIINETHGARTGNEVLVQISDRLRAICGPEDYLARLGGDEFVLLSPALATPDDAHPLADRLLATFADPFRVRAATLEVFASIGLITYRREGAALAGPVLLQRAEAAMRSVKSDSLAGGWAEYNDS